MRLVRVEHTSRRRRGLECTATKAPFMPRVAMALLSWLQESPVPDSAFLGGLTVLWAYYFGWRDSTVSALRVADVSFSDTY